MPRTAAKQILDRDTLQAELKKQARQIASDLSGLESAECKALLGDFVTDLFAFVAEQDRQAERRQRQARGIAEAKARGTRFGRPAAPVPENFDEVRRAWRDGELTLSQAASACGMARGTFYSVATRREESEGCAG